MVLNLNKIVSGEFDPKQIESEWILGLISDEELPNLALKGLSQGFDSESLVTLSVCEFTESCEIQKHFKNVLSDFGGGDMSQKDALRCYAKYISTLILNSEISPSMGAKSIFRASLNAAQSDFHELDAFIYAESEMEERPNEREFFESAIREEATYWANIDLDKKRE